MHSISGCADFTSASSLELSSTKTTLSACTFQVSRILVTDSDFAFQCASTGKTRLRGSTISGLRNTASTISGSFLLALEADQSYVRSIRGPESQFIGRLTKM